MKKKKTYTPRVRVLGNTGTRVLKSRKDKTFGRQSLKLNLKKIIQNKSYVDQTY